jgi:hypothetical protein
MSTPVVVVADPAAVADPAVVAAEVAGEAAEESLSLEIEELEGWLDEQFVELRGAVQSLRESLLRSQETSLEERKVVMSLPAVIESTANRIEEIYRLVNQWEASEVMTVEEKKPEETVPIVASSTEAKPEPEVKPATEPKQTEPPVNVPGPGAPTKRRPLRAI